MKLGLLADIHERADLLATAIEQLRAKRVDQLVVLGDIADYGANVNPVAESLARERTALAFSETTTWA